MTGGCAALSSSGGHVDWEEGACLCDCYSAPLSSNQCRKNGVAMYLVVLFLLLLDDQVLPVASTCSGTAVDRSLK